MLTLVWFFSLHCAEERKLSAARKLDAIAKFARLRYRDGVIAKMQAARRSGRVVTHTARKTVLALMLTAFATGAFAWDPSGPLPVDGPKEPVCGFVKNSRYLEEDAVTQGLAIDLAVIGPARVNEPVTLRLFVHQKPGDIAVNNLQVEHEKYIHLIGVRDDLNEFFHIHPVKIGPGVWEVTHTFTNGGNYKIWTDARYQDGSYVFGHPLLTLAGSLGAPAAVKSDRPDYAARDGYQVTFKHTEPLIAGRVSSLQFLIRDAGGREIETENFLGAPMHLVMVKDDLTVYLHAHPGHDDPPQPVISFSQILPKEGGYKLFAQFRPKGTTLGPDEAILVEFRVNALKELASASAAASSGK